MIARIFTNFNKGSQSACNLSLDVSPEKNMNAATTSLWSPYR